MKQWLKTASALPFPTLPDASAFDAVAVGHPRQEEIERAFEKATALVLERYEAVIRTYGSVMTDFIAGDITDHYEKKWGQLSKHDKKALGGLYQRLMKRGVIVKTGEYRARNQGNASAVYRLKGTQC